MCRPPQKVETTMIVKGVHVDDQSNLPNTPFEDLNNAFIWITVHENARNLKDLQLEGFVITQQHETMRYCLRLRKPR